MKICLMPSNSGWVDAVLADFDSFLIDHAANERKASAMAMSMVAHYPDRPELVNAMVDLALEELTHFRQVIRLMTERQLIMTPDQKDPYVNELRAHIRKEPDDFFLDRLLSAAVIEARGEERFRLLSENLNDPALCAFYRALANSESGHHEQFISLADRYFDNTRVNHRLTQWIDLEQQVISQLPAKSRLH